MMAWCIASAVSVRWIGQRLAGWNDGGLQGAFEDAGYDRETTLGFVRVRRERITRLAAL
jgi:hypothetical protein